MTNRIVYLGKLILLLFPAIASAQNASCPEGRLPGPDVGIRALRCVGPGASCRINVTRKVGASTTNAHSFNVEPFVIDLVQAAREAGLRVGDTLVAIDSVLITTEEGGRRLANPDPRRDVMLLIRRADVLQAISIRPISGCGVRSLSVVSAR